MNVGLCDDCKVLEFDDSALNGFAGNSAARTPILEFKKESNLGYQKGLLKLLKVQHRDDFAPDLPRPERTAQNGFGLCGYLRRGIMKGKLDALSQHREIDIDFGYMWAPVQATVGDVGAQGLPKLVSENGDRSGHSGRDWSTIATSNMRPAAIYSQFCSEVSRCFAKRNLTYESDRLPALSGTAKQIFLRTGVTYLAGIWKQDLDTGLLRRSGCDSGHDLAQHLDSFKKHISMAPSWLWASRSGSPG
ncbi:hypothetical protein N0V88_006730 [Collariella sp. IMI 366227]|nr:hypothetical protein N0V88_006730 [Collariella sp. IMI 366227]